MKVSPMPAHTPGQVAQQKMVTQASPAAQSARERAISMLSEQPVQNATAVQPEEMSAIVSQNNIESVVEPLQQEEAPAPTIPAPAEVKAEEDPELTRQFALLARQERQMRAKIQQREQELKTKEDALAAREANIGRDNDSRSSYISPDELKRNPLGALAKVGLDYDTLVNQHILNTQNPVPPQIQSELETLRAELAAIRASSEEQKNSYKQQQDAAYQQAVKQIETDVKKIVFTDPNFELVKTTGSAKDVVELIEQTFHQDGILLTPEEAAQQVEDYLMEEALKIAKAKKIQSRLQTLSAKSEPAPAPKQAVSKEPAKQQPMKTLTNATSSTRQLSAKERAILAFRGELK